MTILLARIVPRDQLVAVHAPLGEVEWPGTVAHILATLPEGVPLILAPVASGKSLLERVEERRMWPSNSIRWCTSDFKTGPIQRELRRYLKAHPRFGGRVVNAMGMRADESAARARKTPWRRNDRMSVAGREVFDWLPLFDLSTEDVLRVIRNAGQSPHWAYAAGMSRLSCSFCILASRSDLRRAAELRPGLYTRYAELGNVAGPLRSRRRSAGPSLRNQDVAEVVDDRHGRRHFRLLRQVPLDLAFGASDRRLEPVQHVADLLDREHAFFDQPVDHRDHHIAYSLRGGAGHLDPGFRQFPIPLVHFPLP